MLDSMNTQAQNNSTTIGELTKAISLQLMAFSQSSCKYSDLEYSDVEFTDSNHGLILIYNQAAISEK